MTTRVVSTPWVSVDELRQALEKSGERVVLVDTRGAEAYEKGHLDGAVRMEECFTHLATSDPEGLASLEATFRDLFGRRAGLTGDANERVVIYEEGLTSGFAQSCRGYFLLKWLGHPNVSTPPPIEFLAPMWWFPELWRLRAL
jgi:thiosulfate/3-mercaptopyruvate sulfurtransferase